MEESKQPYYLRDLKYPSFEKKLKSSINIYDQILPEEVSSDIHKREIKKDIEKNYIDRFWIEASNKPELVFNKLTESHKKFFGFTTIDNLVNYLNKYKNTTYQKSITENENYLNELKRKKAFWEDINTYKILQYIILATLSIVYVLRGIWLMLSWSFKTAKVES